MKETLRTPQMERLEKILAVVKPLEGKKTYKAYTSALEKAGIPVKSASRAFADGKVFWVAVDGPNKHPVRINVPYPEWFVPAVEQLLTQERDYAERESNPMHHVDFFVQEYERWLLSSMEPSIKNEEVEVVREAKQKALDIIRNTLRELQEKARSEH